MSADAGTEVRRALALLKSSQFVMGNRDHAFDKLVQDAIGHLEQARAGLGIGPAPKALEPALEASIVEWLFGCADTALASSELAPEDQELRVRILESALLSIREWASRLLQKP